MKKLMVSGITVVMLLALFTVAYGVSDLYVHIDTQGNTYHEKVIETDFVLDREVLTWKPLCPDGTLDFDSHMNSVATAGWPTPGGLTGTKTLLSYNGETDFGEMAAGGGYRGANGFISEWIYNEGDIYIEKNIENKGEWNLEESKLILGEGFTIIEKDIGTWGLDTGSGPEPLHPTDAEVSLTFSSDPSVLYDSDYYFNDGVGGFYVNSLPSRPMALDWGYTGAMNDDIEYARFTYITDEPFIFTEFAGIDPYWPDIEPPERPVYFP